MKCHACGYEMPDYAKFCKSCGAPKPINKPASSIAAPVSASIQEPIPVPISVPAPVAAQALASVQTPLQAPVQVAASPAKELRFPAAPDIPPSTQHAAVVIKTASNKGIVIKVAIGLLILALLGGVGFWGWTQKNLANEKAALIAKQQADAEVAKKLADEDAAKKIAEAAEQARKEGEESARKEMEEKAAAAAAAIPPASNPVIEANPAPVSTQNQQFTPIVNLLRLAKNNDWKAIDEQAATLKAQAAPQAPGDRKASRTANNEGLSALKSNDFQAAVAAFRRAVAADPSDVEVSNNFGYSLLKVQQKSEAIQVLEAVLLRVPDRTSTWANLSEAAVGDVDVSVSAMKLAVRFSSNRERTLAFLHSLADSHPNERYRSVIATVLPGIDSIPRNPNDHSQPNGSQVAPTARN